jgi:four helix bundle protein
MATVQKFEDLVCWQKSRELTRQIYREFKSLRFKDPGFCDQIQRAAVSIMSNIAEGFERGTKQEFLNYLYIAKGSAGEVRAQLYVALDAGYLNVEMFKSLSSLAVECSRLVYRLTQGVKISKFQGQQRKTPPRQMSDIVKSLLASNPGYEKYFNPRTGEIEFWRMAEEKNKEQETESLKV